MGPLSAQKRLEPSILSAMVPQGEGQEWEEREGSGEVSENLGDRRSSGTSQAGAID